MIKVLEEKGHNWILMRLGNFLETLCFIVLGWTHFPSWQIVAGVLIMFVVMYSNWTKFVTGLMLTNNQNTIFLLSYHSITCYIYYKERNIKSIHFAVKITRLNSMTLMVLDHKNRDGWHFVRINKGNFIRKINCESGNVADTSLLVYLALWFRFEKQV